MHQTERRAEKPAKKRAKRSKHTRGTATTENTSECTLLPPSPPPLAKRRHRGQDGQRRHKDAQYETCDKPTSSTASVAYSLPLASSASSLVRMERVTAHEQRQRLKVQYTMSSQLHLCHMQGTIHQVYEALHPVVYHARLSTQGASHVEYVRMHVCTYMYVCARLSTWVMCITVPVHQ